MFKRKFTWLWHGLCSLVWSRAIDILLDAALLGFALTFFLPHLQWVFNSNSTADTTFFVALARIYLTDMQEYWRVWIGFGFVVILWLALKIPRWVHETRVERRTERDNDKRHAELLNAIQGSSNSVQALVTEIRQERNERHNRESTDNHQV